MEKTEEDYEREIACIANMFKEAQFDISIDLELMDELLTEQNHIIIKNAYSCYCHNNNKPTEYFSIKGDRLTYRYVINKLIEQDLKLDCNHRFLEGFDKTPNRQFQYELSKGS